MSRLGLFPPPTCPSSRPCLPTDVVLLVNGPPCFFPPLEGHRGCLLVHSCCVSETPFVLLVSLFTSGGEPKSKILLPLGCIVISVLIWTSTSLAMCCCVEAELFLVLDFFLYCVRTYVECVSNCT